MSSNGLSEALFTGVADRQLRIVILGRYTTVVKYDNALQAASAKGYREIVKLLLGNGAEVNAQGGRYRNALHISSAQGHQEIVKLLFR